MTGRTMGAPYNPGTAASEAADTDTTSDVAAPDIAASDAAASESADDADAISGGEESDVANQPSAPATATAAATATPTPRQPALRWMQWTKAPEALTLHLKRFRATGRSVEKVGTHVPFPLLLNAASFCCGSEDPPKHVDELRVAGSGEGVVYELFGVVEHAGGWPPYGWRRRGRRRGDTGSARAGRRERRAREVWRASACR